MASFEQHCNDCIVQLGEPFENVHLWLDAYFDEYGLDHRPFRHHLEGVEEVRKLWGDKAAKAAENHIIRDYGRVPTLEESDMWLALTGLSRK